MFNSSFALSQSNLVALQEVVGSEYKIEASARRSAGWAGHSENDLLDKTSLPAHTGMYFCPPAKPGCLCFMI